MYITKEKLKDLKKELAYLKNEKRLEIAARIQEAKDLGDLSENAEYSEAKEQYNLNQKKISDLEAIINDAEVISNTTSKTKIDIGSTFKVKFNNTEKQFQIVGSQDADPANGKISNESPLGKVFIGKLSRDTFEAQVPSGKMRFEVLEIL